MIGNGKNKGSSSATGSQSWRELVGPRKKRVNSPRARKRRQVRLLKIFGLLVAVIGLVVAAVFVTSAMKNREKPIQISTPSSPIKQVIFETNGVLPDRWLGTVISLGAGTTMMEVDIHAMKASLEKETQVLSASVERVFPSSLKISVKEREPVLRIAVQGEGGETVLRMVSRDGRIYRGIGYPKSTLDSLPYVQPYQRSDGGIQPMKGIGKVADLLQMARAKQPSFYRTWKVVSLEHYSGDDTMAGEVIEIRSSYVPRIIFGATEDFELQLDRLKLILEYVRARGNPSMERIDLSLRGSAAVQFSSGRISSF